MNIGPVPRRLAVAANLIVMLLTACTSGTPASPSSTDGDLWRTATLRDVLTDEEFSLAELEGRVVVVETMAVWCVNCRIQQEESQAAIAMVASPDFVYISLDIDPNEREPELAAYARQAGFDWRFVVASPEVARSLATTFGAEVLSPPSTPILVFGPDGALVSKHLGIQGAGDLASLIQSHLP